MKHFLFLAIILTSAISGHAQNNYWSKVTSGTHKDLLSISFGSSTVGYISGADSLLLKTTNGGSTWMPLTYTGIAFQLNAKDIVHVNFITDTVGFAVVSNFQNPQYVGQLYKTVDGGHSWSPVTSGNIAAYRTFFFNENNGYQIGSAFFAGNTLIKLSAGTWGSEINFGFDASNFLYGIDFLNTNTGITGGDKGFVYRTFNAGATWDTVKTTADSTIHALRYMNDSIILAATDEPMGGIMISKDTGRTWQYDNNTLTFFYPQMKSLAISKRDSFIAVGKVNWADDGVIIWYNNGSPNNFGAETPLNEVTMLNDSIAYVVGNSGLILTNAKFLINSIGSVAADASVELYPNPSSGIFHIKMKQAHSIRVYDQLGREVYTDETMLHQHNPDLSDAPRGVYIVELISKKGERLCKKISIE